MMRKNRRCSAWFILWVCLGSASAWGGGRSPFIGRWLLVQEGEAVGPRPVRLHPVRPEKKYYRLEILRIGEATPGGFAGSVHVRTTGTETRRPWDLVGFPFQGRRTITGIHRMSETEFIVSFESRPFPRRRITGEVRYVLESKNRLKVVKTYTMYRYNEVEKRYISYGKLTFMQILRRVP